MTRIAGWARRAVLGSSFVLLLIGAVGTRVVTVPPRTAAELLADTRASIADHGSAHFTGAMQVTYVEDEDTDAGPGELGSRRTSRASLRGEIADKRMHMVVNAGKDGLDEVILAGRFLYERSADTVGGLRDEKYGKTDVMEKPDAAQSEFFDFGRAINNAKSPVIRSRRDGRTTVSVKVDPHKVFGEKNDEITSVTVSLTIADHALVGYRESFHGPSVDGVVTMAFTQWGAKVRVAAPSANEIDLTPGINEEALAAYRNSTLMIPASIPQGWEVDYADVISQEDSEEGCEQAEIDIDPIDSDYSEDAPYLYVYSLPATCTDGSAGDGARPFVVGGRRGNIATDEAGSFAEIPVDAKTVIQIDTNLSAAEVMKVVGNLVPFTATGAPILGHGAPPATSV
jgi:hypothetical protein